MFTCVAWGLESARVIPYGTVKAAIGEECPLYQANKKQPPKENTKTDSTYLFDFFA